MTVNGIAKDIAAEAIASLDDLGLLSDDTLEKMRNIENEILFRQFYHQGGVPEKRKSSISKWDPRSLDEYIDESKQFGFYKHFLYYDGNTIKPLSFQDAYYSLLHNIDDRVIKDAQLVYGILAGLKFMNKLELFINEYGAKLNLSKRNVEEMININGYDIVSVSYLHIENLIGQSSEEFINYDNGWQSRDKFYAFDISQYYEEYTQLEDKYNEYKEKIWEILKNTEAINICVNNVDGIIAGDVTIDQTMQCIQEINDVANETDNEDNTSNTDENTDNNENNTDDKNNDTNNDANNDIDNNISINKMEKYIIIVSIIIIILLIIGCIFLMKRNYKIANDRIRLINYENTL